MGFAYNKTTIQQFQRQLKIRRKALPVLRGKEAALRKAVGEREEMLSKAENDYSTRFKEMKKYEALWVEYPSYLKIDEVITKTINIAGLQLKDMEELRFDAPEFPLFSPGVWIGSGIEELQTLCRLRLHKVFLEKQVTELHHARRKTTQKVNLYEKVQIPFYEESIRRIKRFLEDKENIATAAKKIAKSRHQASAS